MLADMGKGGMVERVADDASVMTVEEELTVWQKCTFIAAMAKFQSVRKTSHHLTWMGNCQTF